MSTTDRTATSVIRETAAPCRGLTLLLAAMLAGALGACEGEQGPPGPQGPPGDDGSGTDDPEPTQTVYDVGEPVPELVLRIEGLSGETGPTGEFLSGDTIT